MPLLHTSAVLGLLLLGALAAPPSYRARPFDHALRQRDDTPSTDNLQVDLGYEIYQGVNNAQTGLDEWLGIRFAAPPIGPLRWQAPQPPTYNRSQVLPADAFASQCPQSSFDTVAIPNPNGTFASEDCLFLNVYAPEGAKDLPVLGPSCPPACSFLWRARVLTDT